jgi:hypothetical protein
MRVRPWATFTREAPEIGEPFYRAVVRSIHDRPIAVCVHRHERPYKRQPHAPTEEKRVPAMECAAQVLREVLYA